MKCVKELYRSKQSVKNSRKRNVKKFKSYKKRENNP